MKPLATIFTKLRDGHGEIIATSIEGPITVDIYCQMKDCNDFSLQLPNVTVFASCGDLYYSTRADTGTFNENDPLKEGSACYVLAEVARAGLKAKIREHKKILAKIQ